MMDGRRDFLLIFFLWALSLGNESIALKINVRANGDSDDSSSYRQDIVGNSSTETVLIEYTLDDGTRVSQLTDFRASVQLLRVYILGETELGEPPYQCICFLSSYAKDLILPEAVQKLRQKHPDAIRLAEQDNGEVIMDAYLSIPMQLGSISSHLPDFCRDAPPGRILSSRHEIHNIMGNSSSSLGHNTNNYEGTPRCYNLEEEGECLCSLRVCFNWFPCALKYCSNKEGEGEHRCGIKTCRKCNTFRYAVPSPAHCHWDEI